MLDYTGICAALQSGTARNGTGRNGTARVPLCRVALPGPARTEMALAKMAPPEMLYSAKWHRQDPHGQKWHWQTSAAVINSDPNF